MSLTITKTPPWVSFAGNPVKFLITTDNAKSTAGVKAVFELDITAKNTTADSTFRISFGTKTLDFVLKSVVTDNPLYVKVADGFMGITEWAEEVYNAFLANYDINSAYKVEFELVSIGVEAKIKLTSLAEGSDFTITYDSGTVPELLQNINTAGVDPVYRQGFGILMKLWDKDKVRSLGEDFKSVTTEGEAEFNLQEYLTAELSALSGTRFLWPESGTTNLIDRSEAYVLPFFASFAEKYSDEVRKFIFDVVNVFDPRYAASGGMDRSALVLLNENDTDVVSELSDNTLLILSSAPIEKIVSQSSVEKVFFLVPAIHGGTSIILKCKINFTDGTDQTVDAFTVTINDDTVHVYEAIVGYDYLGLGSIDPAKSVKSWEVWISDGGFVKTDHRKYTLDFLYHENERQILFRNSWDKFESVRLTGVEEITEEYSRLGAYEFLFADETYDNAPHKVYQSLEQQNVKASTGWLNLDTKNWMRDLLLSKEVYEICGDRLIPMVIMNEKVMISRDKENLYSLELEYMYAWQDEFYSGDAVQVSQESTSV